jgi:hypothetical protein
MQGPIILFSSLFGSFYLFATSLVLINKMLLVNNKIPKELIIINGVTFLVSGYVIIYNFSLLKKN